MADGYWNKHQRQHHYDGQNGSAISCTWKIKPSRCIKQTIQNTGSFSSSTMSSGHDTLTLSRKPGHVLQNSFRLRFRTTKGQYFIAILDKSTLMLTEGSTIPLLHVCTCLRVYYEENKKMTSQSIRVLTRSTTKSDLHAVDLTKPELSFPRSCLFKSQDGQR